VIAAPTFASLEDYRSRLGDADFWGPYVTEVLQRHELADATGDLQAGYNATYPTFLCGDVVVKFFGFSKSWRAGHIAESIAQTLVATDPDIAAPALLAEGHLYEADDSWPYLVSARMPGAAWRDAGLSADQKATVASELGAQVTRVHTLRPWGIVPHAEWSSLDVTDAAAHSSLPPHLVAQVHEFLSRVRTFDHVFVHGDLVAAHVFVQDGHLSGMIDWGDAMVIDRHYELIQIHRDLFDCDKSLLRAFLEGADWPVGEDFAQRALGLALHRQAVGRAQHHTMDVFEPVAARFPLQDVATLDDLANELFAV
jgi:aminoglycoside phosphotransferase (APT) family kinase protein